MKTISFLSGAVFGAVGALVAFWLQHSEIWWSIVGLAAAVMGILAAAFGKRFWQTTVGLWP